MPESETFGNGGYRRDIEDEVNGVFIYDYIDNEGQQNRKIIGRKK